MHPDYVIPRRYTESCDYTFLGLVITVSVFLIYPAFYCDFREKKACGALLGCLVQKGKHCIFPKLSEENAKTQSSNVTFLSQKYFRNFERNAPFLPNRRCGLYFGHFYLADIKEKTSERKPAIQIRLQSVHFLHNIGNYENAFCCDL